MAKNLEDIDFDNLSEDDEAYIRNLGNPELMRRAGLQEPVTFDLSGVPGSLHQHEREGTPMPVFDENSDVAMESVGLPGDPRDLTLQPSAAVKAPFDTEPFEGSDTEREGKEVKEPEPDPVRERIEAERADSGKPASGAATATPKPASAAKKTATAPKDSTS